MLLKKSSFSVSQKSCSFGNNGLACIEFTIAKSLQASLEVSSTDYSMIAPGPISWSTCCGLSVAGASETFEGLRM